MQYPTSPILKDWAEKLVQLNNRELFKGAVVPTAILFVEDTNTGAPKLSTGKKRKNAVPKQPKQRKPFTIKCLHPALAERLDADYMVIWHKMFSMAMDVNKLRAYLLETLMRIKPGGGLNPPDLKTFKVFVKGVGVDYEDKQFLGLDVLEQQLIKGTTQQTALPLDGTKAPAQPEQAPAPATAAPEPGAPGEGWMPPEPLVKKDDVIPLHGHGGQQPAAGSASAN